MTDYIEVKGPSYLAELVAAVDPDAAHGFSTAMAPPKSFVTVDLGGDEWAQIQYDEVDALTWPYMITVESSNDDGPVRAQSMRLFDLLKYRGWTLRLTSGDDVIRVNPEN